MSQKVDGIINSLSELESEIDAVNLSLAEMKKSLNSIANKEIDSLLEQTRKMATSEAESMISESKSKACLLYTSPSPRDDISSRMPSSA